MSISLLNCILILFTILVHKLIYRVMLWDYASLTKYWTLFIVIFLILNLITNFLFLKPKRN
ncbi:bacteriocin-like WGxF protein [Priestia aryabhattai]|uniref:bacteriocin-like WGxF protein n=2 Tax=Priestia TaxID=2800373 RepID=UPI002E1C48D4|nr:bacteriocin-like WGxF protein [Priestia aryabhattai]MED3951505.1 bacteriocin-like WGxF protein [Priestia aryabhattai]